MSTYDGADYFAGLPQGMLKPLHNPKATRAHNSAAASTKPLPAADAAAWSLRGSFYPGEDESYAAHFARFLETVDSTRVRAIVVGNWGNDQDSREAVALLVEAADRLPALRHLYLGHIPSEENEMSWIQQSDVTPILRAYPALETFIVQGGHCLVFEPVHHEALRHLEFRTGGLPAEVVRAVGASTLPALECLDLWLGVEEYDGDATVADLETILRGTNLPSLTRLGLMNSEIQDEIAAAVASSPILARLVELDLSMGTLGNEGAEALLTGQPLGHLRRLVLSHHFIGKTLQERLEKTLAAAGVEVDLDGQEAEDDEGDGAEFRYVEVAE